MTQAVLSFISRIPSSGESVSQTPRLSAQKRAKELAKSAAVAAGSLALPVGPVGWLTILPEMLAVWKIQSQLVADIASIYGKQVTLSQEQMLYCLFRHTAAQLMRDVVVRAGNRFVVQLASSQALQTIAQKLGIQLTQRVLGKGLARWVPVAGAMGVAAYAYYDTTQVAKTAIALFESEIEVHGADHQLQHVNKA